MGDLEDGTLVRDKATTPDTLAASVEGLRGVGFDGLLTVRVNEPASDYLRDIESAFAANGDGIVVPKLEKTGSPIPVPHWIRHRGRKVLRPVPHSVVTGLDSLRESARHSGPAASWRPYWNRRR